MTVYVYAPAAPPSLAALGRVYSAPQPTAVPPGEGLTSVCPVRSPGAALLRRCSCQPTSLPLGHLGSGPRFTTVGVGPQLMWGGGMSGPRNEGGGWGGRRRPNRFRPHPAPPPHFLGACPGQVDGRDEPYGLRAPGWGMDRPHMDSFCWAPSTQAWETEEPGSFFGPSSLLCSCAQLWKQSVPSIIQLISQCHNKLLKITSHFQMGKLENQRAMREAGFETQLCTCHPRPPSCLLNTFPLSKMVRVGV